MVIACPMARRLASHWMVLAARRALLSAGRRRPTRTAIIPITTNNSTSVNALEYLFTSVGISLCKGVDQGLRGRRLQMRGFVLGLGWGWPMPFDRERVVGNDEASAIRAERRAG